MAEDAHASPGRVGRQIGLMARLRQMPLVKLADHAHGAPRKQPPERQPQLKLTPFAT